MKKLITIIIILITVLNVQAQQDDKLSAGIQYSYSLPLGSFKNNLVTNGSPRGFSADIMYRVAPNWKIGAGVIWQDYYNKADRKLYSFGDGSVIGGVLTNSIQTTAILLKSMWLPKGHEENAFNPFIQAGIGGNLISYQQLIGEFNTVSDNTFKFAYTIGGGAMYDFGKQKKVAVTLSAQFNGMPFNNMGTKNLNNVGLNFGFRFKLSDQGGDNVFNRRHHRRMQNNRFGNW